MTGIDLSTQYLGLSLTSPFMVGACPLTGDLDAVRRLEDAGASAFVLPSLFEEELIAAPLESRSTTEIPADFRPRADSVPSAFDGVRLGDDQLEHLRQMKETLSVPVIGSLNGNTPGGWLDCAKLLADAGADALELNVYDMPISATDSSVDLEGRLIQMVTEVRRSVAVPIAVKLSPFYTSLPHLATELESAGADGLVLFNRFCQPDIDIEQREVVNTLRLSDSRELGLRLSWLSIFSGRLNLSLGVTGGVHTVVDAVKSVMCGAHAIQMVSALLEHGPGYLRQVSTEFSQWMEEHEYASLDQLEGCMNLLCCPDPAAYARVNYLHVLRSWKQRG